MKIFTITTASKNRQLALHAKNRKCNEDDEKGQLKRSNQHEDKRINAIK